MQQKAFNLIARAKIMANIRKWFEKNHFIEVETPILVDCPDLSPNLNILKTEITPSQRRQPNFKMLRKYLITSPEFSMKKILALPASPQSHPHSMLGGLNNIYTITKVFRDGEEDTGIHSIEFTLLEWYRKNADYRDMMRDTEELLRSFAKFEDTKIQLLDETPFPRLKVSNLFKKYAKIENIEKTSLSMFKKIIYQREYSRDKNLNYEQCFNLIFLNEVEPKLPKNPFFLIDYPAPLAALARLKKENPFIAERFELYVNGIELCNGFSELTNGKEQLARFKQENLERKRMGKSGLPIDYELCDKLDLISTGAAQDYVSPNKALAKAGGNALGIDRLVMILLGANSIDKVMY
ncbi:MAG: amino acid--tRNA ligase-related protein [bacterium]